MKKTIAKWLRAIATKLNPELSEIELFYIEAEKVAKENGEDYANVTIYKSSHEGVVYSSYYHGVGHNGSKSIKGSITKLRGEEI